MMYGSSKGFVKRNLHRSIEDKKGNNLIYSIGDEADDVLVELQRRTYDAVGDGINSFFCRHYVNYIKEG